MRDGRGRKGCEGASRGERKGQIETGGGRGEEEGSREEDRHEIQMEGRRE